YLLAYAILMSALLDGGDVQELTPHVPGYSLNGLAVTATRLYAANFGDGTVRSFQKDGGGMLSVANGLTPPPAAVVATHSGAVYWLDAPDVGGTNDGKLHVAVNASPSSVASGLANPTALATDDANVYWADGLAGKIYRVPVGVVPAAPELVVDEPSYPGVS